MKSYKWGIIGPGNIARTFAKDIKLVSPSQKISAVLSDRENSLNEFAREFNVEKRFLDINDFVNNSKVDIAYIATPHSKHYEEIKACLTNNIAVLCEKPIVINFEQFVEIQQLSKTHNTFLMEGMWIRFLPNIKKLLDLVSQKKIGEILSLKAAMRFKAPYDESNRYYDPEKAGGSLLDLGVYCVFLSNLLLGIPVSVKAVGRLTAKNIDEACAILISYNDHSYSILESSLQIQQNSHAEIFGSKGIIRLLYPWFEKSPGIEIDSGNGDTKRISFSWEGHGMQFEIEEVVNCNSQQKTESDLLPHSFNKKILETMDKIRDQIGISYPKYE